MDLDIGCRRRMDELLDGDWEVILPITKPVGPVSLKFTHSFSTCERTP
jgi:hypothetical protein